ncbi:RHH-type proline utilization regulon transcriptional repressor/proline dehydrogenase/delta 1-pyrroline-5-carboxylate dehydrogenase [Cryobacterium mesophilum]|uniref:L-glutamate gamma-semialdehyde dehydrogenase n=1 Tax=Terrimesophilobacter mesophilus TaxID=433647 RepID=A0A4R8VDD3_9MICO|nr:bifunctional proline dehydrogenase/L-glutamate gamma-semialdehyde dehydrogenase [Terrimesophilobacter mesophilus]MBB5633423.1 RHH-type proline utilization regulon transcriptional repressor/proline dehydrogenase/delta 1-pyrroline-5-carboxylate dehydrogenase [Terrimesophilobacter mesophilus]TFB80142.1 aldehyde dehydrogenase family protein [Terrimesophilobacter mesophilus]
MAKTSAASARPPRAVQNTTPALPATIGDDAVELARTWAKRGAAAGSSGSAALLAQVLKDQNGLDFTIGFVDRVIRPEDLRVAARNLADLAKRTPSFLPWYMRFAIRLGGLVAPILPWPVVPIARAVLRQMVAHLIVDARPARLGPAIARLKKPGIRLNINLLGEIVLGKAEAERRLEGTRRLLQRPDVDYVSIKVSSIESQLNMWAFDETVERVTKRLTPLYELAAASATPKFINMDMEEYRDLDLTIAVFESILDQPQLLKLEAGIVLQAYLPDALGAYQRIVEWSTARVARGGAPVKIRLVKGANLAMETVEATMHGWELATWPSKQATDTNYKRVLDWALTRERTTAVRIGIAGHNLFDIAFAHLLAEARGVSDHVEFEMLLGMAEGQADAVRADVGGLLLYTPVVLPQEFDVAIGYLIRRLEENASQENFMSAVFELVENEELWNRERDRFLASLADVDVEVPAPNRRQSRLAAHTAFVGGFANTPDTDPALPANRAWGSKVLGAVEKSPLGLDIVAAAAVNDEKQLDAVFARVLPAAKGWAALSGKGRAEILRRAADVLEETRGNLIEVMATEAGKTIAEGDVEVSEAIDFARYYAQLAEELDAVDGAKYTPSTLIVVTPPWNFPVAIPAGSTLAALASGASVIIKPAKQAQRSGAVMVDALWRAGVPRDVLALVDLKDRSLGEKMVSHPEVDRVILTGGYETAELFRSWRPELNILAETSGKNAIIVTPSADLDLAVADVVKSAFGHAGQKCSAASLVILVGSVARSERFEKQLVDSATTLRVGYPSDPTTQMGPIIEAANGKLQRGLTELEPGERWLLQPEQLDETGRLWSPGIRTGVAAGSDFHLTEFFGPVLGIMRAATLEEAIRLQNQVDYGLTAGLHSLDPDELATWLAEVQAGNLYVNRGITGAIVRRQPFGGWKRSVVGASTKAGGPNYLVHLGSWARTKATAKATVTDAVAPIIAAAGSEWVGRAAQSDQAAWEHEFGVAKDVSGLGVERDVFRYRSLPVTVRLNAGGSVDELARVVAAGVRAGGLHDDGSAARTSETGRNVSVSAAEQLPAELARAIEATGASVVIENDEAWLARAGAGSLRTSRVRLVGGGHVDLAVALGGSPDVAIYSEAVTEAGRIELLPFLREQAIAITAHRFGNPDHWSEEVLPL